MAEFGWVQESVYGQIRAGYRVQRANWGFTWTFPSVPLLLSTSDCPFFVTKLEWSWKRWKKSEGDQMFSSALFSLASSWSKLKTFSTLFMPLIAVPRRAYWVLDWIVFIMLQNLNSFSSLTLNGFVLYTLVKLNG